MPRARAVLWHVWARVLSCSIPALQQTELTAPCAPPGPVSLQTVCQGQAEVGDFSWISLCGCWGSSKAEEGFYWGNGRAV